MKREYTPVQELTEEQETERGVELVRILQLKPAKDQNGKRLKPERYNTTHGTKTALGLFRTIQYQVEKP